MFALSSGTILRTYPHPPLNYLSDRKRSGICLSDVLTNLFDSYVSLVAYSLLVKVAVLWETPGCALAQSSPNLTWAAMGLRAD